MRCRVPVPEYLRISDTGRMIDEIDVPVRDLQPLFITRREAPQRYYRCINSAQIFATLDCIDCH